MTTYMKLVKGATKIKMAAPKQKYVDPILLGTADGQDFNEIVRALDSRIADSAFTVVYKTLIVVHLMLREGEKDVVIRYFSRNTDFFKVDNALRSGNGQSFELRVLERYNSYLKRRCGEYDKIQTDYVRDDYNALRSIIHDNRSQSMDKALNHVESLEIQISTLLKNRFTVGDLSNDLLLFAFKLLVFDLLALYNALNEGIITLLESFFELSHKNAERTLNLYKKFVDLTEIVVKYLKTGKSVGLKIPVIKHITTKLVRSLEEHLKEDNVTHNTFNDEINDTTVQPKGLAQKRLDEIREQKRKLEEQLSHPQLLINPTGISNNDQFNNQLIGRSFSIMNTVPNAMPLNQPTTSLPAVPQSITVNNPFMNQLQTQQVSNQNATTNFAMQQPQQINQFQTPALQSTMTMPTTMTNTVVQQPQVQQVPQVQQSIFQNTTGMVPTQQVHNLMNPMSMNTGVPESQLQSQTVTPLTTNSNNPFSIGNVDAAKQAQEQNNPFTKTNYREVPTANTSIANNPRFTNTQQPQLQPQQVNNPFSLNNTSQPQPQAQLPLQPQSQPILQSAMTAPGTMGQYSMQNQQFAQQQQQQPYEINLIDF